MAESLPPDYPYAADSQRLPRRWTRQEAGTALPDYYALLGVDPTATGKQIEEAYRQQVALLHPDRFFTDPPRRERAQEQLKALNAAMQVLRHPAPRATYDAAWEAGVVPLMPLTRRLRAATRSDRTEPLRQTEAG